MAKEIQLQISQLSGGGQIPASQVGAQTPAAGVSAILALATPDNPVTGEVIIYSPDLSIDIQGSGPQSLTLTTPAMAAAVQAGQDAAAAQATADGAVTDAATAQGTADAAALAAAASVQQVFGTAGRITVNNAAPDQQHPVIDIDSAVLPQFRYYPPEVTSLPQGDSTIGVAPDGTVFDALHRTLFYSGSTGDSNRILTLDITGARPGELLFIMFLNGLNQTTVKDGGVGTPDLLVYPPNTPGDFFLATFKMNPAGTNWLFDSIARVALP